MKDPTRHVLKQFSDNSHDLSLLMAEDPGFLDLCEDYDVCVNALRYWVRSKESEAKDRVDEYRIIARELEEEITQAINSLKQP